MDGLLADGVTCFIVVCLGHINRGKPVWLPDFMAIITLILG